MNERVEKLKAAVAAELLQPAPPTYEAGDCMPAGEARRKLDRIIDDFIFAAAEWNVEHAHNDEMDDETSPFEDYAESVEVPPPPPPPPVHAKRVSTGTGKTQRFAARLAHYILAHRAAGSWLYLVPTHRLGEDVANFFREQGLTAKVYRGRSADDPTIAGYLEIPKDQRVKMCLNLERVKLATACSKDITKSCCRDKQQQCEFYNQCGYQEQLRGDRPHVWIAAHNMLHHPQRAFGKVAGVVIDESFWSGGISGIESDARGLSLDDIALDGADYPWRKYLADILQEHPLGGLERARFVKKIQPEICKLFIGR